MPAIRVWHALFRGATYVPMYLALWSSGMAQPTYDLSQNNCDEFTKAHAHFVKPNAHLKEGNVCSLLPWYGCFRGAASLWQMACHILK